MIRWLVIGIGDITRRRVLPAILGSSRSGLAAVVTRDPVKAKNYPTAKVYTSLEQALDADGFDAVYVASPVFLHAAQTMASLRAGKHVLCEKPMAMNYAEAQAMVKTAEESGRLFGVAYYRRLYPKLIRARELMLQGVIGEPVLAEANGQSWLWPDMDDRSWLMDPARAGGGPLYDTGSHRIDALNFLFGAPSHAVGVLSNRLHAFAVEDSATVLIRYPKGIHGVVDVRWNSRVTRDQFRIIGTDGEMNLDPLNGPALRYAGKEEHLPTHENVHAPLIEDFVSAALDGTPLVCPGSEAIFTDWVTAEAIRTSRGVALSNTQ